MNNIIEKLKEYDFTNFTLGNNDPKENYISEIMKVVARDSENHVMIKGKLDKELGYVEDNSRGIPYPTLVKYLALALEDMDKTNKI